MNINPNTVRIFINTCLWDDNTFSKGMFQAGSDWSNLNDIKWPGKNNSLPFFETFLLNSILRIYQYYSE